MKKKLFIIFLTVILGLIFFNADFCLAKLKNPKDPLVADIGEGSVLLQWEWNKNGGTLKQFKVLYKTTESTYWTAKYPTGVAGITKYILMGLNGNTEYEWRVKAEAQNPADDSNFVDGENFITKQSSVPPPDDSGYMGPIKLKNPLDQDSLWDAINAVIDFLVITSFAIAPILIIYAALLMIFAGGDAVKINKAKSIITWTLVALAVILSAKILPSIIKGAFIS